MSNPVYHFILDHRIGGPHTYVETLQKAAGDQLESHVITTGRGPMTKWSLINLRHYWRPLYIPEIFINAAILIFWKLIGRIPRRNCLFVVHGAANIAPLLGARLMGIPVVWQFHETVSSLKKLVSIGLWIIKGIPCRIAVVSKNCAEIYQLDDTIFLPAFVDSDFWSPENVTKKELDGCFWIPKHEPNDSPKRILTVGNLNPLKGVDILLEALAEVEGPWHLKIVGAPLETHSSYTMALYQTAEKLNQRRDVRVDFLGWQEKKSVRALMATCDIYILPSRSEACPIALLEAMAMGCRCAATDVGDVSLMMSKYRRGRVFASENVQACREVVLEVGNPCFNMADGGTTLWSSDEVAARAVSLYNELC